MGRARAMLSDQPFVPTVVSESANRADANGNELARVSAMVLQNAASFSRSLVDTYFRQMGNAGALSRAGGDCACQAHRGLSAGDAHEPLRRPYADRANCPLGA